MTTTIAIEDVRREYTDLEIRLSGHKKLKFHKAFEDAADIYVVMELCEGGELPDLILAGYTDEDKKIVVQMLSVVAICHLQEDEDSPMKVIEFGLSHFIKPDQRLNDKIVYSSNFIQACEG